MPEKKNSIECSCPPEKTFLILCDIAKELSKGKWHWGIFFYNHLDIFTKGGGWWITAIDNKKLLLKMMWKRWNTENVFIKATVIPLASDTSRIILEANPFVLFGDNSDIPVEVFREVLEKKLP